MNDVTGENTSTYALSDIVTSWLDELILIYTFGIMLGVVIQTLVGAEHTAAATRASILVVL